MGWLYDKKANGQGKEEQQDMGARILKVYREVSIQLKSLGGKSDLAVLVRLICLVLTILLNDQSTNYKSCNLPSICQWIIWIG